MVTYLPLCFLQEKIIELQTALFYNFSSSVFKPPTSLIRALRVDDCGQIWFCMPVHGGLVNELDKDFPCLLQFFRKGANFHVRITGKAHIVNDPEEVNGIAWAENGMKSAWITGKIMLIKTKIQYADYFEQKTKAVVHKREWASILKSLYALIFQADEPRLSLHRVSAKSNGYPGRIQYQ
jgi:general stress protein 26